MLIKLIYITMKNILLLIVALCMCYPVFSQEVEKVKPDVKNEIKVNLLMTLLSFPDISYERVWGNNFGLGLSVGFPIESNETNLRVLPYTRFYFGDSPVKSFFIEASLAFEGYKKDYYSYDSYGSYASSKSQNDLDFGLGVSFGYKYVNSKGLIGELFLGLGRTFDRDNIYPRVGISLGKQF